jgi:DNA-directed RNA polymerase specialized sigma24 family protein
MNLNEILIYINNNKNIDGWLNTICKKRDLVGDLKQHCLLEISKEDLIKLDRLYTSGDLEKYFVQIVRNQYNSVKSSFFKEYINSGFWSKDFIIYDELPKNKYEVLDDNEFDIDLKNKEMLKLINDILTKTNPISRELFIKFYYEGKSYNEIVKFYNINYQPVRNKIRSVRQFILDELNIKSKK